MSKRSRRQAKVQQHQYVGLDVSLAETSIAVVDESGKMLWRGKVDTTPEAIAEALHRHAPHAERIALEAGQLSSWLYQGLKALGLPVICIDARHAKAAPEELRARSSEDLRHRAAKEAPGRLRRRCARGGRRPCHARASTRSHALHNIGDR
jgi:transposase